MIQAGGVPKAHDTCEDERAACDRLRSPGGAEPINIEQKNDTEPGETPLQPTRFPVLKYYGTNYVQIFSCMPLRTALKYLTYLKIKKITNASETTHRVNIVLFI